MPVWRRYLVKETSGRLVELPSGTYDRADDGTAPIPDFAGRCVELVAAVLVGERGAAPRLTEVAFTKLYFDQSGYVDAAKRERMIRLMLESCADRRCRSPGHRPSGQGSSDCRSPGRPECAALVRRADTARHLLTQEFGWTPAPAEVNAALHHLDAGAARGAQPTLH